MLNEILTYLLFAMSVITIILAFKRYELQYYLTDYANSNYPSKKLRIIKLLDAFNIADFKRSIFAKYFLTVAENSSKGLKPPDTPWFNMEFSVLNSNKRLDNALIKYISEALDYYKQSLKKKHEAK